LRKAGIIGTAVFCIFSHDQRIVSYVQARGDFDNNFAPLSTVKVGYGRMTVTRIEYVSV
jgi:hypothetical protein